MERNHSKPMSHRSWKVVLVVAALGGVATAQFPLNPLNGSPGAGADVRTQDTQHGRDTPGISQDMQARQLKRLHEMRQKEVFTDTDRLLQLTAELKKQVDRASKPTPNDLKDVDEIAKLSKRISEYIKME